MAEGYSPLLISLKTALLATAVTVVLGILAARLVIRLPEKAQWLTDGILTLPLVLPPTVIGFFLLMIFGKNSPLGQALLQFGIRVVFLWSGAVVAAIVVSFPLMYRTTKAAFEQMDQNLIDAGRTLGLSSATFSGRSEFRFAFRGLELVWYWPLPGLLANLGRHL